MSEPVYPEVQFPFLGVDLTEETADQKPGTTEVGENVRSLDPRSRRVRGASRSGLSKLLPPQADGTATLIQHLNVIVDPTTAALHVSFDPDPDPPPPRQNWPPLPPAPGPPPLNPPPPTSVSVNDPDGVPRDIPDGGSGTDLGPPTGGGDPGDVRNIDYIYVEEGSDTTSYHAEHEFPENVEGGDLLCVFIFSSNFLSDDLTTNQQPTISNFQDSLGLTWTERASHLPHPPAASPSAFIPGFFRARWSWLYTAKVGATGGSCTFEWDFTFAHGDHGAGYAVIIYALPGLAPSDPVDGAICYTDYYGTVPHPYMEMVSSVTPSSSSNVLVVAGIQPSDGDNMTFASTAPASMTSELAEFYNYANPFNTNGEFGVLLKKEDNTVAVAMTPKIAVTKTGVNTTGAAYVMSALLCRKS